MVTHGEEIYEKNNKSMKYELKLLLKKKKNSRNSINFVTPTKKRIIKKWKRLAATVIVFN